MNAFMEMCQLAEITARRYLYDVEEKDDDDDGSIHVVKCLVIKNSRANEGLSLFVYVCCP